MGEGTSSQSNGGYPGCRRRSAYQSLRLHNGVPVDRGASEPPGIPLDHRQSSRTLHSPVTGCTSNQYCALNNKRRDIRGVDKDIMSEFVVILRLALTKVERSAKMVQVRVVIPISSEVGVASIDHINQGCLELKESTVSSRS